jgi:AcrR family transcriptional regulator
MARSKSEDKRKAILSAATRIFAERGLAAAPTSAIAKAAGIAEGTLFTYFKTKDDLVNELYRAIKLELADTLLFGLSRRKDVRSKLQHIWNSYVTWGVSNPEQRKVLNQLRVSDSLTEESKAAGYAPFAEIQRMAHDAITDHILHDYPLHFIAATLAALAESTMELITMDPATARKYQTLGFKVFWNGIALS